MAEQRSHWIGPARRALFAVHRREGAWEWVQATGGSMRPTIAPGTWMHVEFGASPAAGDIVMLAGADRPIAHRLVGRRRSDGDDVLVTKGDSEPYCDRPVSAGAVLGVVRALCAAPDGGRAGRVTAGCGGWRAHAIACGSRLSGRAAGRARRLALHLSPARRLVALRVVDALARAATKLPAAALLASARHTTSTEGR